MSLPIHKIHALYKEWRYWSRALKRIKKNNDRLLITILIGNNLVNVYTATLATTIAISFSVNLWVEASLAIWISTGVVTFLLLLFWEIIPKSFASKNATKISLFVAPIYKILMFVLFPVIIFIEAIIQVFSKWEFAEKITEEEIESFVDMGRHSWALEHSEHEKIKNILEFWDIIVAEIMTPRVKIEAIDMSSTVKEALDFYISHTHSRIPLYNERIDKIDSFVTVRDLLWKDENTLLKDLDLEPAIKVPLNQPIDKLFEVLQKAHRHMAVVIDEYGWVAGIITIEDIMEEIFWEIRDESDKEVDDIKLIWENKFTIESDVWIEDILEKFELDLEDIGIDEGEFWGETVSYLLTHRLERFPINSEKVIFKIKRSSMIDQEIQFLVSNVSDGKIWKIEASLIEKQEDKAEKK